MMTADFHQRFRGPSIALAIRFLADPHAAARELFADDVGGLREGNYPVTCGAAIGLVGVLLDALGYPENGPNVGQRSWLPIDDDGDVAA